MSVNKNALIRYQVLERCFRNPGRMYFIDDLLEECNRALMDFDPRSEGIQRRQLFDEIRFMESEGLVSASGCEQPLTKTERGLSLPNQGDMKVLNHLCELTKIGGKPRN